VRTLGRPGAAVAGGGRWVGGFKAGGGGSSGKNSFRRVKMDVGRKSFLPAGVFYIFVSATKAIPILRNRQDPVPLKTTKNPKSKKSTSQSNPYVKPNEEVVKP
jgi:hypothetical protein